MQKFKDYLKAKWLVSIDLKNRSRVSIKEFILSLWAFVRTLIEKAHAFFDVTLEGFVVEFSNFQRLALTVLLLAVVADLILLGKIGIVNNVIISLDKLLTVVLGAITTIIWQAVAICGIGGLVYGVKKYFESK